MPPLPCVPQWPFGDTANVLEGIAEDAEDDIDIDAMLEEADVAAALEPDCLDGDVAAMVDETIEFEFDVWPSEEDAITEDEELLPMGGPPGLPPPIGVAVAVYVDIALAPRELDAEAEDDGAAGAEPLDAVPPPEANPVDVGLFVGPGPFGVLDIDIWPPDPDIDACGEVDATPD